LANNEATNIQDLNARTGTKTIILKQLQTNKK
jgi:hypothetical protein